ncbi:uncharacterized protein LOC114164850 [Vigna unguiculata]|uniref:Glycine rich protein n=1 Tax=Vigna unguiculata TaxID=3917 RepID=A0A4D6NSM0_VIGUN|nr:uncharacterized protein LOC114164850 [Vigna unguiculata]QCE15499.1 hypothetical protein DEO72_LG11g2510 [Vigna unguiculata]
MAILGASKFISSFVTVLAILLLLLTSALGTAAEPTIRYGRKLLQPGGYANDLPKPKSTPVPYYGYVGPGYPGRGGYYPPRP